MTLDTIPHGDCWALQETKIARKRADGGCAALGTQACQAAEVVRQHCSANRVGVAIAGPQHISSSAPSEFESMLEEVTFLAPEGVEQPLHYLRSRILARHPHAMLKGGVTLVTVYLEPGTQALELNLWLLEVLAACCLCFDGPWIAMGDSNMEPNELSQACWLNTVNGKIFATPSVTCAGGAGAVLDYFVVSEAMQQVEVVDNSPTSPHWPVRLTLRATSWGHRVLARTRPKPFPTEVPVGPRRQEERFDRTWAAEEISDDLELAWLEWLRAAEAAWCGTHDLCGAQRRPSLGRSKGLVIEHVSLAQATRKDTRKGGSKKAASWRSLRRIVEGADTSAHASTFNPHGCLHLVARLCFVGPRLGVPFTGGAGTCFAHSRHQYKLDRLGQEGQITGRVLTCLKCRGTHFRLPLCSFCSHLVFSTRPRWTR